MTDDKSAGHRSDKTGQDKAGHTDTAKLGASHAPGAFENRFAVELIGPPGTGKTTLARAVAAELERRDISVQRAISARPDEMIQENGSMTVSRSAKLFNAFSQLVHADPVTDALMRLMPLKNRFVALRLRRYLADLASASAVDGLLVQDQGYLCAIAGLALDSGRVDADVLAKALDLIALPEIVVRISVSEQLTKTRLGERLAGQGFAERVLERPPAENSRLDEVYDIMDPILRKRGCHLLRVSGKDRNALEAAVSLICDTVMTVRPAHAGRAEFT